MENMDYNFSSLEEVFVVSDNAGVHIKKGIVVEDSKGYLLIGQKYGEDQEYFTAKNQYVSFDEEAFGTKDREGAIDRANWLINQKIEDLEAQLLLLKEVRVGEYIDKYFPIKESE